MKPSKSDVGEGTYAIHMRGDEQQIWLYESSPLGEDRKRWQMVDELSSVDGLEVKLTNARFESGTSWVYADDLATSPIDTEKSETVSVFEQKTIDGSGGKYSVVIGDQRLSSDNMSELMAEFVDYLIANHGLLQNIDIPFKSGPTNYILNDSPEHSDGKDMHRSREVASGIHLETSVPKRQKKTQMRKLAKACNISISFQGDW